MRRRGFTLIELLVVIAIIGVLASIVLASVNIVRMKARDARRMADMKAIQLALELYYDDNGRYPPTNAGVVGVPPTGGGDASLSPNGGVTCDTWDCSNQLAQADVNCTADPSPCEGEQFLASLVPQYLPQMLVDPLNTGSFYYRYYRFSSTQSGGPACPAGTPSRYLLQVRRFERGAGTYMSPQFCGYTTGTSHWAGGVFE